MFRDLFLRFYSPQIIQKVDLLRTEGINITELIEKFILNYEIGGKNA